MEQLKLKISTIILDLVDSLPRFRRGAISELQDIRDHQRDLSSESFRQRKSPDGSEIELKQITLILPFEHEDFSNIQKGLTRYFSKNKKIQNLINDLKESEDRLYAYSWNDLGCIIREGFPLLAEVDKNLPEDVEKVSLSFYRVLPSVACIIFNFNLSKSISQRMKCLQSIDYLHPVIFRKLWPPNKILHSYSIEAGKGRAFEILSNEKDLLRDRLEKWITDSFKWRPKSIDSLSYIDIYKISGNPKDNEIRSEWIRENSGWLQDYGIDVFRILEGQDFIYSTSPYSNERYFALEVVAKVDSNEEDVRRDLLHYKVRAITVSSTILNILKKYRNIVEDLRGKGFRSLYKEKKLALMNPSNIQELKKTITILSRLSQEIEQSEHLIANSISDAGELRDTMRKESVDLGKKTIDSAKYQLKQVEDAANIIDTGLTNYLSVQNIYIMYKLQKWMFMLSIVVTIATIVGVLSGWENLVKLITIITRWIKA